METIKTPNFDIKFDKIEIDVEGRPCIAFNMWIERGETMIDIAEVRYDKTAGEVLVEAFDVFSAFLTENKLGIIERTEECFAYKTADIKEKLDKLEEEREPLPFDEQDYKEGWEEFERAVEEYGGYRDED